MDPSEISGDSLDDLIGNRVEVRSVGESDAIDEGVVEGYQHPWLRLRNARGELLYIPIYRIRLIKLLKQLRPAEPAKSLMRPASAPAEDKAP